MSKERPILFSGPMVRAILEGRKTQTRRLVKPQPSATATLSHIDMLGSAVFTDGTVVRGFAQTGTRLWVRETHYVERAPSEGQTGFILYKASDPEAPVSKWRPSIHMPRWASRITLEVESVRVERLLDISMEDAIAEGIADHDPSTGAWENPKEAFADLWESINGSESWSANPWVWVVTFKRIAP